MLSNLEWYIQIYVHGKCIRYMMVFFNLTSKSPKAESTIKDSGDRDFPSESASQVIRSPLI